MKTYKSTFLIMVAFLLLTSCVTQRIKNNPISQIKLPRLAENKGRVFFQHRGAFIEHGQVINAKTGAIITPLRHFECTYIDLNPGNYVFRAGVLSPFGKEFDTKIIVKAGKKHYMLWFWQKKLSLYSNFSNSERGSHFMNLHPEQGSKMLNHCHYRKVE